MTPAEERAVETVSAAAAWREEGLVGDAGFREIEKLFAQPWRAHGLVVQAVFLLLAFVAQLALFGFLHTIDVPKPGLVTGIAAIATGEWLIRRRKWFATGVEASLWLGGLLALISALPSSGTPEALLLIAAAAATAAFRVRSALFGVVAAAIVVIYAEQRGNAGTACALGIGLTALFALLRTWRRPSAELFWTGLAVFMPIAGRIAADRDWIGTTIALYVVFGAVALVLALRGRHHVLFFSAAIALAIAGTDLADRIAAPLEAKLAGAGATLLALAWVVSWRLRDRTTGLVATPAKRTRADDALEIAGAIAGSEAPRPEAPPEQPGGRFGGAGATGEF